MENLRWKCRAVNSTSASSYLDKVVVWLQVPASARELAWLEKQCGRKQCGRKQCGRGGIDVKTRPAKFDPRYKQRIEFFVSRTCRRWDGCRVAQMLSSPASRSPLIWSMRVLTTVTTPKSSSPWHRVRRWHGKDQPVFHFKATRYDASRAAPNYIAMYPEPYSRITGEVQDILHIEWRATKARSVRAAGISAPQDLLKFPFRKFWSRRLLLLDAPDPEKLAATCGTVGTEHGTAERERHRRWGGIALSYNSLQETLDRYRSEDVRGLAERRLPSTGVGSPEDGREARATLSQFRERLDGEF